MNVRTSHLPVAGRAGSAVLDDVPESPGIACQESSRHLPIVASYQIPTGKKMKADGFWTDARSSDFLKG